MPFKKIRVFSLLASAALMLSGCNNPAPEPTPTPEPEAKTLSSISVKDGSVKTEYYVGETFTVDGGKLILRYSDNSIKEENMALSMIDNAPNMSTKVESYTVNVSYLEKHTSYNISIGDAPVSSIEVKANTVKTSYFVGDEFSVAGGRLVVNYADHTREEIDLTLEMIENVPNMNQVAENYKVDVVYKQARTSYYINIAQGDTREEVSIGVSYSFNEGEPIEVTTDDEITFYQGKPYTFYYGAHPSEAKDSLSYKYLTNEETPVDLGSEKPEANGKYIYKVYLPEGDTEYKPAEKNVYFKITEAPTKQLVLDKDNAPTLLDGEGQKTVEDITFNYKCAEVVEGAHVRLTKQTAENVNPSYDDNYIEIATPTLINSDLTVEFEGLNKFVYVFGTYNNETYFLLDTLTSAKQTTDRINDYFLLRLVAAPLSGTSVDIKKVSFSYEVGGGLTTNAARGEYSDLLKTASSDENNAYFHRRTEEVFDTDASNRSIGIRLLECSVKIEFNTTIHQSELKYYKFQFKVLPTEDVTYTASRTDTTPKENCGIYVKPVAGNTRVGKHLNLGYVAHETEWLSVSVNLGDLFDDAGQDIDAMHVWLSRYCPTGAVCFDDFRLIQNNNYPVPYALDSISLSDMTLDYARGAEFSFDGVITAHYNDGSSKVIANDDEGVQVSSPNMSSSGEKEVTVSYTEAGVTKSATYKITVTGEDPKAEETLDIIDDAHDLASVAHKYQSNKSYDVGTLTNNSVTTYNNSNNSIEASGFTINDSDLYYCLALDTALVKDVISVRFFVKNLGDNDLYIQLYSEDPSLSSSNRALRGEGQTKGDVSTNQSSTYHFTATDAGNGWTRYEYTGYIASHLENGIKIVRISNANKVEKTYSYIIDGIEVY